MSTEPDCSSFPMLLDSGVAMLCAQEARRRGSPAETVQHVRRAAFNGAAAEADRMAAEQAVAAVLIRQVRSADWWREIIWRDTDIIGILAALLAVAHALACGEGPRDAVRDGKAALRHLRHRIQASQRDALIACCSAFETILGPPVPANWRARVGRLTAAPAKAWRAVLTSRRQHGDETAFDPDPWCTPQGEPVSVNTPDAWASLLAAYASQFGSYTTMLWQVPALGLTAQAFLMTIALGSDSSNVARVIAALLSVVISVASTQLMHDQRGHAMNHGQLALRISRKLQLAKDLGGVQVEDGKPARADAETLWAAVDHRIYHIWTKFLILFIVTDAVIIALVIASAVAHRTFGYPFGGISK